MKSNLRSCFRAAGFWLANISGKLVLIEHLPDASQESRQFLSELVPLGFNRKHDQFLADEIVERALACAPHMAVPCKKNADERNADR